VTRIDAQGRGLSR